MKKWFAFLMSMALLLSIAVPFAQAKTTFSDVPRSHWAYEAITEMAEKGIIKGYSDGKFRPDNKISRAEFAKIMIAAAGIEINNDRNVKQTFADVDRDHWAFLYVELAKNYLTGYKSGSRYTYKPNEAAVREDIAVALVRLMGYDRTKKANEDTLDRFRDEDDISRALRPYIAIAVDTDLIKGFSDRTFRPQAAITRAEAAMLLYRAIDKLDGDTKVIFPVEDQPKPEEPKIISITHTFSDSTLKGWDENRADGSWLLANKQVTAYSDDKDLYHYFLPLVWDETKETKRYELQVDVNVDGTDGYGGLYFNGDGTEATAVMVGKDAIYVNRVTDAEKKETTTIAKISYKLQKTNKLKVVVEGDTYSIYANGKFVYSQESQQLDDTKLGLYLNREANRNFPDDVTMLDNFSFKATLK